MRLGGRDGFAIAVLLYALAVAAWVGPDAWIVGAVLVALTVAFVVAALGLFLARMAGMEPGPRRWRPVPAVAGAVALVVSCVMAASLAREEDGWALVYWALGLAMLLGVAAVRVAYAPPAPRR